MVMGRVIETLLIGTAFASWSVSRAGKTAWFGHDIPPWLALTDSLLLLAVGIYIACKFYRQSA